MSIEAMKQMIATLEDTSATRHISRNAAMRVGLKAIEQAEKQEPVAWGDVKVRPDGKRYCRAVATTNQSNLGYSPLYTTPQAQEKNT